MQPNSTAHAAGAAASSATTAKSASGKPGGASSSPNPSNQVKGNVPASPLTFVITPGGASVQTQAPNAPLEQKLATNEIFRPLGVSATMGGSDTAASTSPSPGALFAQPLFQGLPQLPDGSPEDPAVLATSSMGAPNLGGAGSSSLGGGSGLVFGPLGSLGESKGEGEDQTLNRAANLKAGQISTGFVPLGGSSGKLGGPLLFGDGAGAGLAAQPSAGELITGTYATYHGPIDLMVPQITQDYDKSLDMLSELDVSKAKKFRSKTEPNKTVLAFLAQNARNISFVINQEELCDNVLSVTVMEQLGFKKDAQGIDMGLINDFTLIDFQYLVVLMNQGRFIVFDCSMVLEGSARQLRYVNQDQIKPQIIAASNQDDAIVVEKSGQTQSSQTGKSDQSFIRIEYLESSSDFDSSGVGESRSSKPTMYAQGSTDDSNSDPRRVVVFGKYAHRIVCLEFLRSDSPDMDMMEHPQQVELQIPSKLESRMILDVAIVGDAKQVAVLLNDNLLTIFDIASRTAVFRAKFNDATDSISQMFYVADNYLEGTNSTPLSHANQSPSNETTFMGFFLMVETKLVQKDTTKVKKGGEQQISVSRSKHLRKLHLVQVQQTQIISRSKIEKRDKIEQIDALTFGEDTPKLVEFVRCLNKSGVPNYFAFLLTRERVKSNGALKLITVKMRWAPNEELKPEDNSFDQDDQEETKTASKSQAKEDRSSQGFQSKWKLKFDFVTSLGPKIENFWGEKQKPTYLNVIEDEGAVDDQDDEDDAPQANGEEPAVFYIYTGVGRQSIVFKRSYAELSHAHPDEEYQMRQIEEARAQVSLEAQSKKQKKKNAGGTGDAQQNTYQEILEQMNREHQKDKESIKALLAKQIQDVVSSELDQNEDPAILSQSQVSSKPTQNPEQQPGQEQQKKKGADGQKKARPVSAKKQNAAQAQQRSNSDQLNNQPMYKTKGKGSASQEKDLANAPENKDAAANVTTSADAQQQSKAQKSGKDKSAKEAPVNQGASSVTVPPTKKQQQDQIIENYQELNKKFTELHMKMNSLQQQVKAQKDLQIQVEQTIAKAVKTALPEIVKKQVEETMQPLMQKQTELLDLQIRQNLIPRIEAHIGKLQNSSSVATVGPVGASQQIIGTVHGSTNLSDQAVRKIIHSEFKQAMSNQIMPELERELKQMLAKVKEPIANVNKIFYEKLVGDEQKNDHMVQVFEQRLQFAQQQAQQQQHYQQAFAPPHMQPQPSLHHSYSLQAQTSQTPFAQPIAIYHSQPQPQYQVLPAQHQQLFNASQDQSMIIGQIQQQQQAPQPLGQPQMQNQLQPPQPGHAFHSQTSFGGLAQTQQTQANQNGNTFVQQMQQQASQITPTNQANMQQMAPQIMQTTQLQPTNTSFVPTVQPQQQINSSLPAPSTMQQNVSAPTFTPQATAFHPTNTQMLSSINKPSTYQAPKPIMTSTTSQPQPMPAMKLTANIGESAQQKASTTVETAPPTSENVAVTTNSDVVNQGEEEKVKTADTQETDKTTEADTQLEASTGPADDKQIEIDDPAVTVTTIVEKPKSAEVETADQSNATAVNNQENTEEKKTE